MTECTLCGLATPEPPVQADGVAGEFCCQGCLEVSRTLDDPTTADPGTARDQYTDQDTPDDAAAEETETAYLDVDGMHCATCEAFLEGRATGVEGVETADASYGAGVLRITYAAEDTDLGTLTESVSGMGYDVRPVEGPQPEYSDDETVGRLLIGIIFGFMTMMWYLLFLYPTYLGVASDTLLLDVNGPAGTYVLWTVGVLSSVVLGYTGAPILRGAWVSVRTGRPDMDLLVALAAGTAYAYSLVALGVGRVEVYFDVAVVIVVVVTVGRYYETRVRNRAGAALADLAAARVNHARRQTPDGPETVSVETLTDTDEVLVRAGERIPVDGTILEGRAAVDESLLTGEARPVARTPGERVLGGTIPTDGRLLVEPDADGSSTVDRLIEVLWKVQSQRGGAQRMADRLATVFVPLVIVLAVLAGGTHLILGSPPAAALLTGLAVLVVSCPCALGLATPLAVASGLRTALAEGVVITDRAVTERVTETEVIALDKTGTLTTGGMAVEAVIGAADTLTYAAAVEQYAEHPIAETIVRAAETVEGPVSEFNRYPGLGAAADVSGTRVLVGRAALLEKEDIEISESLRTSYDTAVAEGKAATFVAWEDRAQGVIVSVGDRREAWTTVIEALAERAQRILILTGDDRAAVEPIAQHPEVDDVFAGIPPEGKAEVVHRLQTEASVAMVGDGSNDAPALAAADVGIAMGGGTDIAAEAADAVVVNDDLQTVPCVFDLTAAIQRRIRENLGWAFVYNIVAVPLAAIGLLNPLFAAIAMSASSLLVVANSSRSLLSSGAESRSSVDGTTGDPIATDGGSE